MKLPSKTDQNGKRVRKGMSAPENMLMVNPVFGISVYENYRKVRPGIVRTVTHAYQVRQKFWILVTPNHVTENIFYVTKDTVLPSVLVTFLTESNLEEERVYLVATSRSLKNLREVFGSRAAHNFMKCYLWQGNSLNVYEIQHGGVLVCSLAHSESHT